MFYVENKVNKVCNDTKSQSQSNERKSYLVPEFGPIDTMGWVVDAFAANTPPGADSLRSAAVFNVNWSSWLATSPPIDV